jgi:hypothetical protein
LLHAIADRMLVVLCLYEGDGNVGLVIENVVGPLGLYSGDQLAPDDDPSSGKGDLLANLGQEIPSGLGQGWSDELRADIAFAEVFLVHHRLPCLAGC